MNVLHREGRDAKWHSGRRLGLLAGVAAASLSVLSTGCGQRAGASGANVVRIGYQKESGLDLLRLRGDLDKDFKAKGISVQWVNFPAGPQLAQALGEGSIDLGSLGDTPSIFAQAAGIDMVYAANTPGGRRSRGGEFLVPKGSTINSTADLKGKRVALQYGSASTYWLVQVLKNAGLKYSDIQAENLTQVDALAAFGSGRIDAWLAWDPYETLAERNYGARVVKDKSNVQTAGGFYIASREFATKHADRLKLILADVKTISEWSHSRPLDAAKLMAPTLGLDVPTVERLFTLGSTVRLQPVTEKTIGLMQKEADTFFQLGLLPHKIDVRKCTLTPQQYAYIEPDSADAGTKLAKGE